MQRTKKPNRMPDAINVSTSKHFTKVPNELLRNPEISGKAKALLSLLLSNSEGWTSYFTTIKQMMMEQDDAIRSGLKELEVHKYLMRIRYREKESKRLAGSFWAYTDNPGDNKVDETIKILERRGFEPVNEDLEWSENPAEENPGQENPGQENPAPRRPREKKTNNKKTNSVPSGTDNPTDDNSSHNGEGRPTPEERAKQFLPQSETLANIIRSTKKIKISQSRLKSWANEIRKLVETDGVDPSRIDSALSWYSENIGGEYIPVVESGAALREKFIKLEEAIQRGNDNKLKQGKKPSQGVRSGRIYHDHNQPN